jgi:hypothetical protein
VHQHDESHRFSFRLRLKLQVRETEAIVFHQMRLTMNIYKNFCLIWVGLCLCSALFAFDLPANRLYRLEDPMCDSLIVSNGKALAVKNLLLTEDEIAFSLCDDPTNNLLTTTWKQIKYIKKSDGTIIDKPPFETTRAYKKALKNQQKKEAREQARKEGILSPTVGVLFLVLGILASLAFVIVWFAVAWADSIFLFILTGLLGYSACVFIFNAAFRRLMPKKKRLTRILWAAFSPLLTLALLTALIGLTIQ